MNGAALNHPANASIQKLGMQADQDSGFKRKTRVGRGRTKPKAIAMLSSLQRYWRQPLRRDLSKKSQLMVTVASSGLPYQLNHSQEAYQPWVSPGRS